MAYVLFSAMRNEGPYLLDWIAFHRAIGFDKIVIVTNDCNDGSEALLKALAKNEVVTHFDQQVPEDVSPQRAAVALTETHGVLDDGDWGIFLDADEYLNIHIGDGTVADLAQSLATDNRTGMLINWRLFGDSGNAKFPGSYVSDDFTGCEALSKQTQFKTFFQKGDIAQGFSGDLHRCQLHPGKGTLDDFVIGSGGTLANAETRKSQQRHLSWLQKGFEPYSTVVDDEIGYGIAQVNHYAVRDPVSFALKQSRGRGHISADATGSGRVRHSKRFYRLHNRNEEEDRSILRWAKTTAAEKQRLLQLGDVAQCQDQIDIRYRAAMKGSEAALANTPPKPNVDDFPLTFPDAEKALVQEVYANAREIVEYGSGGSTILAAELGKPCLSVESDRNWAGRLNAVLAATHGDTPSARAVHVDIGETKAWGYPKRSVGWTNYWRYPMQVWEESGLTSPDVILIDGRMRMGCFAATLMNLTNDAQILFDDYANRPKYHAVEQILKPDRIVGRMAAFKAKPGLLKVTDFKRMLPWFFEMQ